MSSDDLNVIVTQLLTKWLARATIRI